MHGSPGYFVIIIFQAGTIVSGSLELQYISPSFKALEWLDPIEGRHLYSFLGVLLLTATFVW